MKNAALPLIMLCFGCITAAAQDWELPVVTLRYGLTDGAAEDPVPDEDILVPASMRNTVELHIRESADPLDLGFTLRYSAKDYLLQSGDYSYISAGQDVDLSITDAVDLGMSIGLKWLTSPEPDSSGLSKDTLTLNGGITADIDLAKGTGLDASVKAQYDLHAADVKSRQLYTAGVGFSSRLGQFLFGARYRGTLRLPMSVVTDVTMNMLHDVTLSLQWDPNR
jgi:hypothetical protein